MSVRQRPVATGRAVAGGFLVAASAVGLFVSYTAATARQVPSYVVAARDISVGERLAGDHLDTVPIDLPPAQRARAFTAPAVLVGAVAVGPVAEGDLVQATAVAERPAHGGRAELSFPIAAARALGGRLDTGERVDVIATYGSGEQASVRTVAFDAVVVRTETGEGGIAGGAPGSMTVVLALLPDDLEAVAHAAVAADVSLARTTGLTAP